jgi:ABC-2 type transport system permease protein
MHKVLRIAKRDYMATVRTKGFIIGLLLAPLMMGGGLIVIAVFKDRPDTTDRKLAVVDHSGLVAEVLVEAADARNAAEVIDAETGKKVKPRYTIEIVEPSGEEAERQQLDLSDRVRSGDLHAFVVIGPGVLHPSPHGPSCRIAYHAKNSALDGMRDWIGGPINLELRRLRLEEAGIDEATADGLFDWLWAEPLGLVSADSQTGEVKQAERRDKLTAVLIPLIMPMLLFILLMMGAVPLLSAVTEEKSQRIAEVMLGSVKPFHFMLGKILGGVSVSLTAAAVYVIGSILVLRYMELDQYVPYHLLPWFLVYAVMAIFMFGSMMAALGASCNDASEVQSISLPAMIPAIFPFLIQMPVVMNPQSTFSTGLSLFPIFTPMLMLIRQGTPGGIPAWQPWLGLVLMTLTTLLFIWAGGRVFRTAILMQGTPPKLKNLVRWALCEQG